MRSKSFAVLAIALAIGGCGRKEQLVGRPGLAIVDATKNQTTFPAPTRDDLILQQRSYVIGPFDKVSIDVYAVPELSRTVQVDASGTIALPLVGNVAASGKSTSELAAAIADRLRGRYVRDPQVTVNTDTVSQVITVDGQVQNPGLYPVVGRMTLMRALASAKGMNEFARTEYIVVYRRVGGKEMAALFDVRAIRAGYYEDPEVYANDLVYVGEAPGKRAFQTIIQAGGLIITPIVAVLNQL